MGNNLSNFNDVAVRTNTSSGPHAACGFETPDLKQYKTIFCIGCFGFASFWIIEYQSTKVKPIKIVTFVLSKVLKNHFLQKSTKTSIFCYFPKLVSIISLLSSTGADPIKLYFFSDSFLYFSWEKVSHDPLEIFRNPLTGRDPSVEKLCTRR